MTDLFDNLIDSFSSKDLRTRVRFVIAAGLIMMSAAFAGIYCLGSRVERISIPGSAQWGQGNALIISLSAEELQRVADLPEIAAEFLDPANGYVEVRMRVVSIDPASSVITLDGSTLPPKFKDLTRMNARLIVIQKPYWQMLWGR